MTFGPRPSVPVHYCGPIAVSVANLFWLSVEIRTATPHYVRYAAVLECTCISENTTPLINVSEPVSNLTSLTSFAEVAPSTVVESPPEGHPKMSGGDAGYTSDGIPPALKNNFNVASFQWTYAQTITTLVHSVEFPSALLAIPNIAMKMAEFRYHAADIKVRVKITSTPFHFGSLGVCFAPRLTLAAANSSNYYPRQRMSNPDSMFIDVGGRENLEFTLKRVPITTFDPVEGATAQIGTLLFFVRAPLRMVGGDEPTPLTVSVFANFENLELAGYGEKESSLAVLKNLIRHKTSRAVKQSGKKGGTLEAKVKSESGVISSILEGASSFAPLIAATPLGEFAPLMALGGAVAPFFKSLGLSKPSSVAAQTPTIANPRRGLTTGSGLSIHEKLALHQDASVADIKEAGLGRPDIRDLAKYPAWLGTFDFDETSLRETVLKVIPLVPTLANRDALNWWPGMCCHYANFFNYWRGSLKFKIVFHCAQFTSATLRITHNTYNEATTDMETSVGNRVSEVLEIRGNTEWKRVIPYQGGRTWSPVIGMREVNTTPLEIDGPYGSLEISIINPATSTADAGDAVIYYSIYFAGGDDIDFHDYCGYRLRAQSTEIILAPKKQSLLTQFSETFKPMHPALQSTEAGYIRHETQTNLIELCHKETPVEPVYALTWPAYPKSPVAPNHISCLLQPFLFWRGSVNLRLCYDTGTVPRATLSYTDYPSHIEFDTSQAMLPMTYCTGLNLGNMVVGSLPGSPQDLAFTVPYLGQNPFRCDWSTFEEDYPSYEPSILHEATATISRAFMSLGDDFVVGHPVAPDAITVIIGPPPSSRPKSDDLSESSILAKFASITGQRPSSSGAPSPKL